MKNKLFYVIAILISVACSKNNDSDECMKGRVVAQWKLIEVLSDPGDGSGVYESVNSNKTICFHADETFSSNGDVCDMGTASNTPSFGLYSIEDHAILPSACGFVDLQISFEINDNELVLIYPCFEPCRSKYIKVPTPYCDL